MSKPTMSNYFVYRPKLLSCISAGKQSADKNKILCGFKITNRGLKICTLITWFLFWWESNTFKTCHKSTKIYIFETIHILLPHCKSFADVSTFSVRIMNLLRFKIKFKMWVYNFWVLLSGLAQLVFPGIYKVNNGNIRAMWENCSKLTIKTPSCRCWRRYGVFIVNFGEISHIAAVLPLLILNK